MSHGQPKRFGKLFSFLQKIIDLTGVISSEVDEIAAEQNAIKANYEQNENIILNQLDPTQEDVSGEERAHQIIQALRNESYGDVKQYLNSDMFNGNRRKLLKAIQKLLIAKANQIHLSINKSLKDANESLNRAGELLELYENNESSEAADEFFKALETARESYKKAEAEEREVIKKNMEVAKNISDEFDTVTSPALQRGKYEKLEQEIKDVEQEIEELQERALEVLQDEAQEGFSPL